MLLDEIIIVGVIVGFVVQGMKLVVEVQFEGFIYLMMEQIVCYVVCLCNCICGCFIVLVVWCVLWGGGICVLEYYFEVNEYLFINIFGLCVVMFFLFVCVYGLLLVVICDLDLVMFFEFKCIYCQYKEEVLDDGEVLLLDVCFVLCDGIDVILVIWGVQVKECLEVVDELVQVGISVEVIDVVMLILLDFDIIVELVQKIGCCVIVYEVLKIVGYGVEIVVCLSEECMYDLFVLVECVIGFDMYILLFCLEMKYLLSVECIVDVVKCMLVVS